ncbi:MAG TPA: hypothetical protein VI749_03395 [Candidatus Omnitrophota bacterium]|nr:hypothetical protein [Candidatus Omnitrophota bacterium]
MQYDTLILTPFREMMATVFSFIPTLLFALGILIVGTFLAHAVEHLIVRVFKQIEFDTVSDKMGLTKALHKGGLRRSPSSVIGCLSYWVLMVTVLISSVKALGITVASGLIDKILAYIPSVITGAVALMIGMLIAKFVGTLVYITAKNTDMPAPATLARVSKWAIVIYVSIIYLKEIGFVDLFVGAHYTIFIAGVVFALALAFGLAGKDVASHYLNVIDRKVK